MKIAELLPERLVEPVGLGEILLGVGRERIGAFGHGIEGAAGRGVHHEKRDERHGEERWEPARGADGAVKRSRALPDHLRAGRPKEFMVAVTIGKPLGEVKG